MASNDRGAGTPLVLLVPAVAAAGLCLLPVIYIVVRATEGGLTGIRREVLSERTAELVMRSATLAAAVVLLCAVIGTALAWVVVRSSVPGRRFLLAGLAAPLAIPTYVAAYAWLAQTGLQGFYGACLVLTACCYPYVLLPVAAALRGLDQRHEDVARTLGSSRTTIFWRVILPQLRSPMTSGCLLVATYVLSDFGAVSLMRYEAFTQAIFLSYRASFDRTPAAVLGCLLAVLTLAVVAIERRARGARVAAAGRPRQTPRAEGGRMMFPFLLACATVVAISVLAPLGILLRWAIDGRDSATEWSSLASAAWSTAQLAVLGSVVTTAIAVAAGIVVARSRARTTRWLESALYLGHSLPGLVIALALVFFGVRYANPIYQRTPLLIVAYAVLFLPLAVTAIRAAVEKAPEALDDTARTLGAGPLGVVRRVLLPLSAPGVAAGAALVLLTVVKELPATLLLRPTGTETLATRLWTETAVADYGRAAPYALAIVVLATVPMLVLTRRDRLET